MSAEDMSIFSCDVDFCTECGSILPLPGLSSTVTCILCKNQTDITKWDGLTTTSHIVFNKRQTRTAGLSSEDFAAGPLSDHQCLKCGNDKMTYTTRQTRSADEGQTVFYTCPKCGFQETENS